VSRRKKLPRQHVPCRSCERRCMRGRFIPRHANHRINNSQYDALIFSSRKVAESLSRMTQHSVDHFIPRMFNVQGSVVRAVGAAKREFRNAYASAVARYAQPALRYTPRAQFRHPQSGREHAGSVVNGRFHARQASYRGAVAACGYRAARPVRQWCEESRAPVGREESNIY